MNNQILNAFSRGRLIILLGAGASFGSRSKSGQTLPMGSELAEEIAAEANLNYENEGLGEVYAAARHELGSRLDTFLEKRLKHCIASQTLCDMARYPWARIYTLNIDDAIEDAFRKNSKQKYSIREAASPISERDPFLESLDIIKLNGSVDRLHNGLIFSPSEYAKATSRSLSWYEELSFDFIRNTFIFIGTKLNEPLMKYHIEQYKSKSKESEGVSYVLTPSASIIEKKSLLEYKLEHISGTLEDFITWLKHQLPNPPTALEIAKKNLPSYAAVLASNNQTKTIKLLENVDVVRRDLLVKSKIVFNKNETIKSFYKGFKPNWIDIIEGVPAELRSLDSVVKNITTEKPNSLIPLLGSAGSGKTTLLMQAALRISENKNNIVYFLNKPIDQLHETLEILDSTGSENPVFVFTDSLDILADQIRSSLRSRRLKHIIIIGSERINVWNNRTKAKLSGYFKKQIEIPDIDVSDAKLILTKLERYGNWTRLGKMRPDERLNELIHRAKKQLLIALLETTAGRGFEQIIEDDYNQLGSETHKAFLAVVGLATVHRTTTSFRHADRALKYMGFDASAERLAKEMTGVVSIFGETLQVRHPLYARHLFEMVIDPIKIASAIKGNLHAFTAFKSPVIQNVSKTQSVFYKGILNHAFLNDMLKGKRDLILAVYADFEKSFENDGLYWLQYGLSYRDFGEQYEALDKLNTARQAYAMEHTLHAYAQQLMIVGSLTNDKNKAYGYLKEAKDILERVDVSMDSDDTYPIVTLAEGNTALVHQYEGDVAARAIAKSYANSISNRVSKGNGESRLKSCWEKLAKYASGGTWTNDVLQSWHD